MSKQFNGLTEPWQLLHQNCINFETVPTSLIIKTDFIEKRTCAFSLNANKEMLLDSP